MLTQLMNIQAFCNSLSPVFVLSCLHWWCTPFSFTRLTPFLSWLKFHHRLLFLLRRQRRWIQSKKCVCHISPFFLSVKEMEKRMKGTLKGVVFTLLLSRLHSWLVSLIAEQLQSIWWWVLELVVEQNARDTSLTSSVVVTLGQSIVT